MLKGERVVLRLVREDDLEELFDLDADVYARGQYFPLHLRSYVGLRTRYNEDGMWGESSGTMLIVDKVDNRILGTISRFKANHYYNAVEIGYILFRTEDRGKGLGSEALNLFSRYLFDSMTISRIQIQVEPDNHASRRVAEKCGFLFEGTARCALMSRGVDVDINIFSLVRSDLR
jgi:RimJ/RimL family protein N-acetyltransferase